MAANMNALIRIAARVDGANTIQAFSRDLKGLDGAAKLSTANLGRMQFAINKMGREAGNTTSGIRAHISALENLRSRVDIGGKAYGRLGTEIDQLRGKLRGLDGDTQKAGATLKEQLVGLAATAGVGQITRGIIAGAAEFDQAVRTAAAIASSGGGDFLGIYKRLRDEIQAVAAVAAGTPTEVANLAVALQRAGFTADETSQSLRGIVAGAEATGITFEEMGSITADTLRQFGIATTQTGRVVDVLVDSANSANQKVQDVGEAMKYAAPIAHSLGITMEDTAAAVALLAETGIRGSDAGTALRTGLTRLQIAAGGADSEVATLTRGNVQLTKALSALGSQVLDAEGKLRPLDQVIMALKTSMDGLSMTDKSILAKALFGTEAGSKFVALMNQSSEGIRKMFGDMRDAGGEAQETQQKMQGFAYAMKVLGGNVQIVTNAIGDSFIAVLAPAVGLLNAAISASQELPKPLRDTAAAAAAAGIAIGGITISAAALKALGVTAMLSGMVAALQGLTVAAVGAKVQMIALNAVALVNPWVALAAGITAATVALATYRSESQKVAAAAAQGDPAAIRRAQQRTGQMSAELEGLMQQRGGASGRERASIDRRTSKLRQDIAREQAAIRQGQRATGGAGRVLPVAVAETSAAGAPNVAAAAAEKAARQSADREQRFAEEAARAQIEHSNRIHQHGMELLRKRYEYERELQNQSAENWVKGYTGAARSAAGIISSALRGFSDLRGRLRESDSGVANAEQGLRSAQRQGAIGAAGGALSITSFTASQLQAATKEASRFTGVANMCSESVKAFYKSLGITLPGVTAWADTVRKAGKTMTDWSHLRPGDIVATGRPGDTPHVGVYTGGDSVFHQSRSRGLKAGNFPDLNYFKQGGYFVRPSAMAGSRPGAAAAGGDAMQAGANLAQARALAALEKGQVEKLKGTLGEGFVLDFTDQLRQQNAALQDQSALAQLRNRLIMEGVRPEIVEAEAQKAQKFREVSQETGVATAALERLTAAGEGGSAEAGRLREAITLQNENLRIFKERTDEATAAQIAFNDALRARQDTNIGAGLREGAQGYIESIGTMRAATTELAQNGIKGVENALVGLATTGKANFREFAVDMLQQTARMIIQQVVLRSVLQAVGAIGGSGDPTGGLGSSAANMAQYAPLPSFNGGGYTGSGPKSGGLDGKGGFMAMLHPRETVIDHTRAMPRQGAGNPINVVVNVDAKGTQVEGNQTEGAQLGRVISAAVQAELVKQQRPGGILAGTRR